jgi:hypothetical protein
LGDYSSDVLYAYGSGDDLDDCSGELLRENSDENGRVCDESGDILEAALGDALGDVLGDNLGVVLGSDLGEDSGEVLGDLGDDLGDDAVDVDLGDDDSDDDSGFFFFFMDVNVTEWVGG